MALLVPDIILLIVVIVVSILIAYVLYHLLKTAKKLLINIIVGFLLIIITNLLGITDLPIWEWDWITIIVTALTGAFGALVLIILNVLGFYPF